MAYEIVKRLKCITNKKLNNEGLVVLTVGEIYDSAYSNSTPSSESFGAFNDDGELQNFNKRYFEVYDIYIKENTGWEIKCNDCYRGLSVKDLIKNNYKCPRCGQVFLTKEELVNVD
ncbi:hypothetical protein [Clostridium tagluense]|uniref:Uncharacterized protein n=1 Tax=Clostridium tagluense TaxID=360422 RepID=A0A401UQE3_9CLOT|nr:hypothetical protein [Clostridium tagluense]GCD11744.1 hypothetical protein Ctaglu_33670 [Clostridium tagluense]